MVLTLIGYLMNMKLTDGFQIKSMNQIIPFGEWTFPE